MLGQNRAISLTPGGEVKENSSTERLKFRSDGNNARFSNNLAFDLGQVAEMWFD
jgi:hypothetical protein